ncbi:MAG: transcription elongation factor GreB [Pseudomonadales bacterium]|nr:transcription elongation factor GreB [Pseudomonadales bacterium]
MSRYRPPAATKSNYLTNAGAKRLKAELHQLWKIERPQVTQSVTEAAAQGDRSENAEYTYGKKRLREIDRRVRYLSKRLESAVIVNTIPHDTSKVYFGAWVTLEETDGTRREYRIVGPDEIGEQQAGISMDAPLGRNLLGKTLGTEIVLTTPAGKTRYLITAIRYTVDT